ncbi:hypothetical protein ACTFIR_008479 [Dictyostelium discoideum]
MGISSIIIILFIIVLLKKLIKKEDRIHRINKNIPGPKSKLLVGNLFDLKGQVHEKLKEWYEQYGSIYRIEFGSVSTVVLTEYATLKEAFVDNGEIFQSRFQRKSRTTCNKGLNLANSNGEYFNHLKKTLSNEITNQKMKKNEKIIKIQVELLSEFFNEISGGGIGISKEPINNIIKMYSLNVMLSLLFNIHFPYNNNSYQDELMSTITRYFKSTGLPYPSDFIPILYPFLKNKPKEYFEDYESVKKLITRITNEYQLKHVTEISDKSTIEEIENYQPKNILESLLKQYRLNKIPYDGVIGCVMDLILAGSDTTGNTCLFSLVALVNNSNIQEKLFNEISNAFKDDDHDDDNDEINDHDDDELNGANDISNSLLKLSYFSDRIKTPYLVAFIKEVKRYYPCAPLSVPHLLTEDCEIQGYKIAKGTQVIQNIYSTHLSPSFCSNPLEFSPERFLDSTNEPKIIPFGIGQRKCPGENIFEIEIYIFLVYLIKKFKFSHPIDDNLQLNDRGQFGLSLQCPQLNIKVESR